MKKSPIIYHGPFQDDINYVDLIQRQAQGNVEFQVSNVFYMKEETKPQKVKKKDFKRRK